MDVSRKMSKLPTINHSKNNSLSSSTLIGDLQRSIIADKSLATISKTGSTLAMPITLAPFKIPKRKNVIPFEIPMRESFM